MSGERNLEVDENKNQTPFKVQYFQYEDIDTNNKSEDSETFSNYTATNESSTINPFNIKYSSNEALDSDNTIGDSFYREFSPEYGIDSREELSTSEVLSKGDYYEKILQNDIDSQLELFSNEIHDPKFTDMLGEMANETEEKFQNYMYEKGDKRDFIQLLAGPDFQSNFDGFFERNYRPAIVQIEREIDKFSQYLEENMHTEMNYEIAQSVIDSYPVNPELFSLGGLLSKAKKAVGGAVNLAKKVASTVGKFLPLNIIVNKVLKAFKGKIEPVLKSLLQKVMGKVPEKYRPLAQKALDSMTGKINEASQGVLQSEIINENIFPITGTRFEAFELATTIENHLYGIDKIEHELDEELFLLAQNKDQQDGYYQLGETVEFQAMEAEEHLDSEETEFIESEFTTSEIARNNFITGLTNGTQEIKDLTQNFLPAYPLIKMALKIPGARNTLINTIAGLASPILAKIIGKDQAAPLSKVLVKKGFDLLQLETPAAITKEQYLGSMAANIVTEATDRILQLPNSILESGEDILESFVNESIISSTANNVPSEVLNHNSLLLRQIPSDTYWGLMENGKYKMFSKTYQLMLDPKLASTIHTGRRSERLLDILRNQGWDCINPIPINIRVFQATPFTRRSMIAKNFLGGTGSDKIQQILWLSPEAATMLLKEPQLGIYPHSIPIGSISGLRFYIVQIQKPESYQPSSIAAVGNDRPNDVNIRFISPDKLEVKLFLNSMTYRRIKNSESTIQATALYKELEFVFVPTTRKILKDLLTRLNVPAFAINQIIEGIQIWILKTCKSNLSKIVNDFLLEGNKDNLGATIIIYIDLPLDFQSNLSHMSIDNIGRFISDLINANPSGDIKLTSGYNL